MQQPYPYPLLSNNKRSLNDVGEFEETVNKRLTPAKACLRVTIGMSSLGAGSFLGLLFYLYRRQWQHPAASGGCIDPKVYCIPDSPCSPRGLHRPFRQLTEHREHPFEVDVAVAPESSLIIR